MGIALISGSTGLIGSEAARHFAGRGLEIVGVDNDLRRYFFGDEASTNWQRQRLEEGLGKRYRHVELDIREREAVARLFEHYGSDVKLVVHTAAQPSHDWAAKEPHTDFAVNAVGTLNLLEATRQFCARTPCSSSPRRTKSTATRPTACRWSSRRRAGK